MSITLKNINAEAGTFFVLPHQIIGIVINTIAKVRTMKTAFTLFLLLGSVTLATAQKIAKPTLVPKDCTEMQKQTVREGVKLHDAKKFADAVDKYQQVVTENPDCTLVIYELSMTYYSMGEKTKAMETAYRGSKYKSDQLPLFYLVMANVIDDIGKPDEAVKIYLDAIKILEGEKDMVKHLSSVHYNLAVAFAKQKKYLDARKESKKAVEYDHRYASPTLLLANLYHVGKYKIPAFLAAARFLSLEATSQRSQYAARVIRETLTPAPKNKQTGDIEIFLDLNAAKDEGDFAMYDLFLGTLTTIKDKDNEKLTDEQRFADAVGTVIALVAENKDTKSTFVGKNYVPFLVEAKKRGYSEVIGYIALHHGGNPEAGKWIDANETKVKEFFEWSKSYELPK